jgi:hypothetical protein
MQTPRLRQAVRMNVGHEACLRRYCTRAKGSKTPRVATRSALIPTRIEALLQAVFSDSFSPAICMNEDCDFTCEMRKGSSPEGTRRRSRLGPAAREVGLGAGLVAPIGAFAPPGKTLFCLINELPNVLGQRGMLHISVFLAKVRAEAII